jgi:hypothetical protein
MTPLASATLALALLSPAADGDWVKLFNGKDLSGWQLPVPAGGFAGVTSKLNAAGKVVALTGTPAKGGEPVALWRVEDGLLIGGGPMTHLFTERGDFDDFHLKVEVKVNDGGNSGIFFRADVRPGIPAGYEAQVNATHKDPVKSGSLYPNGGNGLDKYRKENCVMNKAAHGPDEFFTEEVICQGARIRILVNGKQTVDFTDPYDHPARQAGFKKGHIALQAHDPGSVMTFKSVEIKRLALAK